MRRRGAHPASKSFAAASADYGPGPDRLRAGTVWLAVRLPLDARLEAALRAIGHADGGKDGCGPDVAMLKLEGTQPAGKRVFREISRDSAPPAASLPPQGPSTEHTSSSARQTTQSFKPKRKPKLGRAVDVSV